MDLLFYSTSEQVTVMVEVNDCERASVHLGSVYTAAGIFCEQEEEVFLCFENCDGQGSMTV